MNEPAISVLIAYPQQPPVNDHSSATGGVYFGPSLILSPCTLCIREAKALVNMCVCAGSSKSSPIADAIITKTSCGSPI